MISESTAKYLQEKLDKLESWERYRSDSFTTWIRHIITILVGLLTILVAFSRNSVDDCITLYLFSSILISIAISIVSGIIFLFHHISDLNQIIKFERETLDKRLRGDHNSTFSQSIITKKIYKICEYIFYIFSVLTIILLVIYGILINT